MDYIAAFGFHWFWFAVASLLLIIEVMHGRFMFMAVSVAAAVVGAASGLFPYVSFAVQCLFFVVISAVFVWMSRSFLQERAQKIQQQQDILKNRRYVGTVMKLVNGVENGHTTLNIDGVIWNVRGADCAAGSQVKVVDMGEGWLEVEAA